MYEFGEDWARAIECLLKASLASNAVEHQNWLTLADAWLMLSDFERAVEQELQAAKREADVLIRETRAVTPHAQNTAEILEWRGR
jgi:hypothetical protein